MHFVGLLIQVPRFAWQGSYDRPLRRLRRPDDRACAAVVSSEPCVSVSIDTWPPYVCLYVIPT